MRRAILLGLMLCAYSAFAQNVVFNNTNTAHQTTSASFSNAFTITAAGPNLVAFAAIGWDSTNGTTTLTAASVTLGGNSMTSCGAAVSVNDSGYVMYLQWYYLVNPPTGSQTLTFTTNTPASTHYTYANVITYTGVNTTTPVRPGSYFTKTVSSVFGGTISALVPSQQGDIIVASEINQNAQATSNMTSRGTAGNYGFFANADHVGVPQFQSTYGGQSTNIWSALISFSIQSAKNSSVAYALNGSQIGTLPGQAVSWNGIPISSFISGNASYISTLVSPVGVTLINEFWNGSGGTNAATPTTTTLGNSTLGDFDYKTWSIANMGSALIYSNALSIGNLPHAFASNDGTINTATGTLGLSCTTIVAGTACGYVFNTVTNWNHSATLGYWQQSTCTGGSQDCGAQTGLNSGNAVAGLGAHINGVTPCSFNGWSIDSSVGTSTCLTGKYAPNTLYRINIQLNDGETPFTATFSTSTPVVTATNTLAANEAIEFTNSGGGLPTGISASTIYYVLPLGLSTSQFEFAAVQGGPPIQVSSAGTGTQTVTVFDQITICNAAGTLQGTINRASNPTPEVPGRYNLGVNGEEPTVAGFIYYYYGLTVDGTGKYSNTQCIL